MEAWIESFVVQNSGKIILGILAFMGALGTLLFRAGVWKGFVDKGLDNVERFMIDARADLNELLRIVKNEPAPAKTSSPILLTEIGLQMARDIEADKICEFYARLLYGTVRDMNSYEVQEFCRRYAQKDLMAELKGRDPDSATKLELYAYNKGKRLFEILEILAIILRDKLLERIKQS
ncbi:MAG: hypothetical protein OXB94_07985 [Nitrospira sp.]|nr:hypothetical protein [Nitrospira sp.]